MADVVVLGVGQAVGVRPPGYVLVAFACAVWRASIPSGAEASRWRVPQTLSGQSGAPALFTGSASLSVAAWIERDQSIDVCELIGRSGRFGPAQRILRLARPVPRRRTWWRTNAAAAGAVCGHRCEPPAGERQAELDNGSADAARRGCGGNQPAGRVGS